MGFIILITTFDYLHLWFDCFVLSEIDNGNITNTMSKTQVRSNT